jgi:hypothetical protein
VEVAAMAIAVSQSGEEEKRSAYFKKKKRPIQIFK